MRVGCATIEIGHRTTSQARCWSSGAINFSHASRTAAFTAPNAAGLGTVPSPTAARLDAVLTGLRGRRVVLHGTGRHTLELAQVIARHACVVGFTDDDPRRHGGWVLGLPVVSPRAVAALGAGDVVISSWIHEEELENRRFVALDRKTSIKLQYSLRF